MVSDPKPNAHTVRTFRKRIVTGPWLHTEDRELFMQTLQERRFDSRPQSHNCTFRQRVAIQVGSSVWLILRRLGPRPTDEYKEPDQ